MKTTRHRFRTWWQPSRKISEREDERRVYIYTRFRIHHFISGIFWSEHYPTFFGTAFDHTHSGHLWSCDMDQGNWCKGDRDYMSYELVFFGDQLVE